MLTTKTRTAIITLIAACGFATATVAPAVSQAQPIEDQTPVVCEYEGETFGVGERIVVFSGAHYDYYYCGSDGVWHKTEHFPPDVLRKMVPIVLNKATHKVLYRSAAKKVMKKVAHPTTSVR